MFDPELVRTLCSQLLDEKDPKKIEELSEGLHAIVSSNTDELRLKLDFLARHYPDMFNEGGRKHAPRIWLHIME
jgi:hypothetical protein